MNAQTPVTYGPPRCDSKGLCEPQTSPPAQSTTTVVHVIVDNNGFAGRPQISVDAGPDTVQAIQHQTHVLALGFTFVVVAILVVGTLILGVLKGNRSDSPAVK